MTGEIIVGNLLLLSCEVLTISSLLLNLYVYTIDSYCSQLWLDNLRSAVASKYAEIHDWSKGSGEVTVSAKLWTGHLDQPLSILGSGNFEEEEVERI